MGRFSLKEAASELNLTILDLVREVKNKTIDCQKDNNEISFLEEDLLGYKINNLFQYSHQVEDIIIKLLDNQETNISKLENLLEKTIDFLLEHEMLVDLKNYDLLDELNEFGWLTADELCKQNYHETALELFPDCEDEIMERWTERDFYSRTMDAYPSLMYAVENGLEDRAHKIIDSYYHSHSLNLSRTILELCQNNHNYNYFEHLLESVDITNLEDLPEIHLAALSNNNHEVLQIIAEQYWVDVKECDLNLETAEIALGYAVDADDDCLIEEIKEVMGINDPKVTEYSEALELINNLRGLVSNKFKISLPDKVNFVEKKGNYASIYYQTQELEDDYGTEIRT